MSGPSSAQEGATNPGRLQPAQRVGGGRFVLLRRLGGGAATVWLAKDEQGGPAVALKFPPPELLADPEARTQLRALVRRLADWNHPNILQCIGWFETEPDRPFLALENAEGGNLYTLCRERDERAIPWPELEPLAWQLCSALAYAHSRRALHGALHPANLLLTAEGRLKVTDFGLAALLHSAAPTQATAHLERWASPQQRAGEMPRVSDDIYSLGATLDFLAGDGGPPLPAIPPEIVEAIAECQAEDPADRPASVRDLMDRWGWGPDGVGGARRPAGGPNSLANQPIAALIRGFFRRRGVRRGLKFLAWLAGGYALWRYFST